MSKEQIEEMCRLVCNACEFGCGFNGLCSEDYDYRKCNNARETALALFNAGYRKQSEGYWIENEDDFWVMCSECGTEFLDDQIGIVTTYKYCPNCGAKMKGGEE